MVKKKALPILLILINAMPILAASLYFPAMPMMAEYYQVPDSTIKYSVSFFQLGLILTALIYGPLSDRFGRRPVLLLGYSIFFLASIVLSFALPIEYFLLMRFVQACGAGVSMGLGQAVIRDVFTEREASKLMAQIWTVVVIVPAIAPIMGGYLTLHFGWIACFIFTSISIFFSIITLYLAFPETLDVEKHVPLHPRVLWFNYKKLFQHKSFVFFSLINGFSFSGLWFYRTVMPFVFIKYMGVSIEVFGYYAFIQVMTFSASSFYVQRVVLEMGNIRLIAMGHAFLFMGCFVLLLAVLWVPSDPLLLSLAYIPYAIGLGLLGGTSTTKAMSLVRHTHGAASALIAAIRQFFMAFGSIMAAIFASHTFIPAIIFMTIISCFSLISFILGQKYDTSEA